MTKEKREKLRIRLATELDCKTIYNWQSAPNVRKFSRNPNIPSLSEHKNWFAKAINDPEIVIYICLVCDFPIGMLRCDLNSKGKSEVSIIIDPNFQNKGLGYQSLKELIRMSNINQHFTAYIKTENIASIKIFEKVGFIKIDKENYEIIVKKDITKLDSDNEQIDYFETIESWNKCTCGVRNFHTAKQCCVCKKELL
jgi:RimJ/RimL family protein N-acetyltransferase